MGPFEKMTFRPEPMDCQFLLKAHFQSVADAVDHIKQKWIIACAFALISTTYDYNQFGNLPYKVT